MNRSYLPRAVAACRLFGFGLLVASSAFVGCKSTERNGAYIVHKKKPPKPAVPSDPALQGMTLEELVKQPHIQDLTYQRFVRPLFHQSGCDGPLCHGANRGGGLHFDGNSGHI